MNQPIKQPSEAPLKMQFGKNSAPVNMRQKVVAAAIGFLSKAVTAVEIKSLESAILWKKQNKLLQ